VDYCGKRYLSVNYRTDLYVSVTKRPKKTRAAKPTKKRLRVDKSAFDSILDKLIKSKPVKRG
jgi:hypothetical protein